MPQPSIPRHRVALLGFSEFERRTLGSCFRLAGARKVAYVLTTRVDTADFLVADSDHRPSVEVVRVTERIGACVFVGAQPPEGALNWMPRPIDPLRVMRELDALVSLASEAAATAEAAQAAEAAQKPAVPRTPQAHRVAGAPEVPHAPHAPRASDESASSAATASASASASAAASPSPPARRFAAAAATGEAEEETAPAAFNMPRSRSRAQPPAAPPPRVLQADWQPETQPGWEPEWPLGWQGAGQGGPPLFVPAADASLPPAAPSSSPPTPTPTPEPEPARTRMRPPMQAWVDSQATSRPPATGPRPSLSLSPRPPRSQPMALVVDDSEVAARFLQRRLESLGVRVTCANNSGDAIALFEAHAFDLVFLDVELGPRSALDGLALCQRIRRSASAVDSSVVLVSAHHSEIDRARGLLAGCDAYLGKPLVTTELSQLLSHHGIKAA